MRRCWWCGRTPSPHRRSTTPLTPCAGKAEFLGCILNDIAHLAAWSSGYGYGYGKKYDKYGYGQHSARKTQ